MNHHQFFTWSEVERITGEAILFVLSKDLIDTRKEQGWQPFDLQEKKHVFLKSIRHGMRIIRDTPNGIHVFQSFFGLNKIYLILIFYALWKGGKVVVLAEPYSVTPAGYFREELEFIVKTKVLFRPLLYKILAGATRLLSGRSNLCVLTISDIAQKQFVEAGFLLSSVFPFGYFIPADLEALKKKRTQTPILKMVFLGSLLRRKGVDLLLHAMAILERDEIPIALDLYGAGNFDFFSRNRSFSSIQHKGLIPPEEAQQVISEYDVLILPSVHDGWGVVVNEALLQKVPVVVSDKAGASCLVRATQAGRVFKSGDLNHLIETLRILALDAEELQKVKYHAANFDKRKITPVTGATYFVQVMEYFFWNMGEKPHLFWDKGD